MRQRLQEKGPSGSFIARTNRSPAALTCGLNARVMSLSYANRGIEGTGDGVTEERAVVRAQVGGGALLDDGGAPLVWVFPFYVDGADCGRLDT